MNQADGITSVTGVRGEDVGASRGPENMQYDIRAFL